jgi:signal transduction histidine kinase/DNA-binding response OmpR family regulator
MVNTCQNILLINSRATDRQYLRQFLIHLNTNIIEAASGVEAVQLLQSDQIDLVITDIAIGPLNGWKLIRTIRSGIYPSGADLPIILVTRNWCERVTQLTARGFGINRMISFDNLDELNDCVRSCLDQSTQSQQKVRLLIVSASNEQDYDESLFAIYDVDKAADIDLGFTYWQQQKHDLVLIDSSLGRELGRKLLSNIITLCPDQPVVVVVEEHDKMCSPELILNGAADIIVKPYSIAELMQVTDLALKQAEYQLCHSQCSLKTENLQQLEQLFHHVVNSMPSVLIGVDRQTRVTFWNDEAEKVTAVSAEKAVGVLLSEVFPQFTCLEKVEQALVDREIKRLTKVCCGDGADQKYIDITIYPLLDASSTDGVIRMDDVTDRALLEKRIIQSEKMVSMGHLAAGLAHEINNPLAGIMQNVQVVKNRLDVHPQANKNAAEQTGLSLEAMRLYLGQREISSRLDAVMTSGGQAAKMIENMLSFSRSDDSASLPESLSDLLDRSVELATSNFNLKQKFDFRLIQIRRDYDHSVPLVKCNRAQIQQVFINLLMNGAFFMDIKRQELNRQGINYQPRFDLRIVDEAGHVRLEVEDNGPGIDSESQKHIFDPFYTASRKSKGAGLGLSISYFIVCEHHHGNLSVDSTPSERTRFIITLPK